jgi:hypothetical protein
METYKQDAKKFKKEAEKLKKEVDTLKDSVVLLEALLEAKKKTKNTGPKEPPKYKRITIEEYAEYQMLKRT